MEKKYRNYELSLLKYVKKDTMCSQNDATYALQTLSRCRLQRQITVNAASQLQINSPKPCLLGCSFSMWFHCKSEAGVVPLSLSRSRKLNLAPEMRYQPGPAPWLPASQPQPQSSSIGMAGSPLSHENVGIAECV